MEVCCTFLISFGKKGTVVLPQCDDVSIIRDINLAPQGMDKINWVSSIMPVLNILREEFRTQKPFAGLCVAVSVHLEAKTAFFSMNGEQISKSLGWMIMTSIARINNRNGCIH